MGRIAGMRSDVLAGMSDGWRRGAERRVSSERGVDRANARYWPHWAGTGTTLELFKTYYWEHHANHVQLQNRLAGGCTGSKVKQIVTIIMMVIIMMMLDTDSLKTSRPFRSTFYSCFIILLLSSDLLRRCYLLLFLCHISQQIE